MRAASWLWLFLGLFGVVPAAADEAAPPPVGVHEERTGGARRLDAVLPGPIVAVAVAPAGAGGAAELLVLARPENEPDGPRTLSRLDLAAGRLVELRAGLPGSFKALAFLTLEAGAAPHLVAGGLGELWDLGTLGDLAPEPRSLLRHPGFDLRSLHPGKLWLPGADLTTFAAAEAGSLRLYRLAAGQVELASRFELPLAAKREASGLLLASPPVTPLLAPASGRLLFAVGPEAHGSRRLRTLLIDPVAGTSSEAWALLPGPEAVAESWYRLVDGRPFLFVMSQSSDKLGLLEEKRLRVFGLSADRTRLGKPPLLAFTTDTKRWHDTDLHLANADGDGKADLVLLQPAGLSGDELKVEALPGLGGGRFLIRTRRSSLDPAPQEWLYGEDWNGDGVPDLAAVGDGALMLYAGSRGGSRPLAGKPWLRLPLPSLETRRQEVAVSVGTAGATVEDRAVHEPSEIAAADLDGDGRRELLLLDPSLLGRGVLRIVFLPPATR